MLSSVRRGARGSWGVFSPLPAGSPRAAVALLQTEPQTGQALRPPFQVASTVQVGQGAMPRRTWRSLLDPSSPCGKAGAEGSNSGKRKAGSMPPSPLCHALSPPSGHACK